MKFNKFICALKHSYKLRKIPLAQLHATTKHDLPIIVSFTSIPSRFQVIHLTLRSLLSGTRKPSKIILWLNDQHEGNIPASLNQMIGPKFEIRFVPQDSPHLKLVRSLQSFPDQLIVTCDDDLLYAPNWLESLYQDHLKHPKSIIAHETRAIGYFEDLSISAYRFWYRENLTDVTYDALLALGFGGVLYPPGCFHEDICNESLYLELTPKADDLWFKAMSFLAGTEVRQSSNPPPKPVAIPNSQSISLRSFNINQDGNRLQWQNLTNHYPLPAFLPWSIAQTPTTTTTKLDSNNTKVDVVIPWVNGLDPAHQKKLQQYLTQQGLEKSGAANPTRFNQVGELSYCVQSILKHAPWVNRIHIVTDNQTPNFMAWLDKTPFKDKIEIVDHKLLFKGYEQNLPTFNARSITAMLWRIPNLAENFIYLNDDMMLIQPVAMTDFFREGKVVLRGYWKSNRVNNLKVQLITWLAKYRAKYATKLNRPKNRVAQRLAAKLCGFEKKYFHLEHLPHAMRVSTLRKLHQTKPALLAHQTSFKLRSKDQYVVESLAAHAELAQGSAIIDNTLKFLLVKPEIQHRKIIKYLMDKKARKTRASFICIQSLDQASEETRDFILARLLNMIKTITIRA